jgi:SPP1 family predicted phage head-tail adaptor
MQAGKLRERIVIEKPASVRSTLGETTLSWDSIGEVWAYVWAYSGRDVMQAMQVNMVISHKFYIRYRDDVTPECRIRWRGRIFEVAYFMERPSSPTRRDIAMLEIMTKEVA